MKKILSLIMVVVFLLQMSIPTIAIDASDEAKLKRIAEETINITIEDSELLDSQVTTYSNIDSFVKKIREDYPQITDYDIAEFLLNYMGQDSEAIPVEQRLIYLEYDNFSVCTEYFGNDNTQNDTITDMISPCVDWTSTDNAMKISTSIHIVD